MPLIYLKILPPRSITFSGLSCLRKKVFCEPSPFGQYLRQRLITHTCESKTTPLRSSNHKSFSTRSPSSRGSKQLVKHINPLGEVMAVSGQGGKLSTKCGKHMVEPEMVRARTIWCNSIHAVRRHVCMHVCQRDLTSNRRLEQYENNL